MAKLIDLTGQKFGRWTVLEYAGNKKWLCRCSCDAHTERIVSGNSLRKGLSVSCDCFRAEQRKKAELEKEKVDLIGKEIGNFKALANIKDDIWKCICLHCGKEIELSRRTFMNGKVKCDCIKKNKTSPFDLIGKQFGLWTVLEYVGNRKWHCRCECGNESDITTNQLIHGKSTKCRSHRNKNDIIFPQWFIDDLKDKSLVGKINTHDIVEFICKEHGGYKQRVGDHIKLEDNSRKCGCPLCSKAINITGSIDENEIVRFIQRICLNIYIEFHNREVLGGKEIDIYIPSKRVGIEYCGSAFHATENGIYENKDKYYHRDKFLSAKDKGIHLITVYDKDFIETKWIVLQRIRHILLDSDKKFFIPDYEIVYTDNDYDTGEWLKEYGYIEIGQEDPESFSYRDFTVYRCGKTKWKYIKEE